MDFQKKIDITNEKNSFMSHNGIRLTQMELNKAVVEATVTDQSLNLFGGVHGGVFLTMADCAAGGSARSGGGRYVTVSSSFEFFQNTRSDHVTATGIVRHRGNTICVSQVDVTDGDGRLLASGTFTMFRVGDDDVI